jgi:hypothetical protein
MSTTYILEPDDEDPDDLESFMAELDADLKRSAGTLKKVTKKPIAAPEVVVQQWFPHAVALWVAVQKCVCGATYESVEGIYLEDVSRNGAIRRQRHIGGPIPADHLHRPYRTEYDTTGIQMCPRCFVAPPQPAVAATAEPNRHTEDDLETPCHLHSKEIDMSTRKDSPRYTRLQFPNGEPARPPFQTIGENWATIEAYILPTNCDPVSGKRNPARILHWLSSRAEPSRQALRRALYRRRVRRRYRKLPRGMPEVCREDR